MKILALNPPFHHRFSREQRSPAVTKSGTLYYPMWLAYAVGYLEQQGHEIRFIDAPALNLHMDEVLARLGGFSPGLVIMNTSTPSIYNDIAMAGEIKKAFASAFVVFVGPHVSALPAETLGHGDFVDAIAIGEFDQTVVDLAMAIEQGKEIAGVAGIVYKKEGASVFTALRTFLTDLDALPFVSSVYKKHLDHTRYFYSHSQHPIVTIVTGRGCPFKCTYCVYPQTMHGNRFRSRSVEKVADEFAYIYGQFPDVREIMIEDDTFTVNRQRCRDLAMLLIRRGLNRIPWSANSRADVDYETMALLKKAGCRLFCVGFESGDQTILDNIKKGTDLVKIRAFARDARQAGILVHGCFMVGNRGETRATLRKTLDLALELNPDTVQFFPIMVYPGTADYQWVKEQGFLISEDFSQWVTDAGLHNSVVSNPALTYAELTAFCDEARRRFYLRPRYILAKMRQSIVHPTEAKRNLLAFRSFFRHLFGRARPRSASGPAHTS
ncbi:MAG: hypothetical protein A2268_12995 [Candidatus Raymondbacteria bacterium RifOxyA12_full_50_37]|uniref:Uncharacterized protein n=1 Tax=Candidatus Raymondbacteria bacterium RIFOXYD12_FULL_49_13 TaxID=1817890 RepID=A0A1F7F058_UNCRA|nr:MAG: hypothetical protein A2268_12995 [Candidatus Raymondbacteria bacterium RifOxyA12_full_50_37]OGJ88720.1 MAG: hypothetical protein A2350_01480 [Candidatus Raymondbacteria bacterium RifOxyB12_full_50_8]OGJ92981.1 MAG: hypothetical protein A2248_18130 [Candidatus Raymondbacteria bacterium RIFOXYA2_FULL_49_16]OGJ97661.1 MAG: hypothetical protein A2487_13120 [Candidatus Raymondbacteria bacterium RifOxyC12_full_50_8]OGJ99895.1 MAG: hypothetical protein A2519_00110 [Candidatus Raymondbacteria b